MLLYSTAAGAADAASVTAAAADAALQYFQDAGIRTRDSATADRCATIFMAMPCHPSPPAPPSDLPPLGTLCATPGPPCLTFRGYVVFV